MLESDGVILQLHTTFTDGNPVPDWRDTDEARLREEQRVLHDAQLAWWIRRRRINFVQVEEADVLPAMRARPPCLGPCSDVVVGDRIRMQGMGERPRRQRRAVRREAEAEQRAWWLTGEGRPAAAKLPERFELPARWDAVSKEFSDAFAPTSPRSAAPVSVTSSSVPRPWRAPSRTPDGTPARCRAPAPPAATSLTAQRLLGGLSYRRMRMWEVGWGSVPPVAAAAACAAHTCRLRTLRAKRCAVAAKKAAVAAAHVAACASVRQQRVAAAEEAAVSAALCATLRDCLQTSLLGTVSCLVAAALTTPAAAVIARRAAADAAAAAAFCIAVEVPRGRARAARTGAGAALAVVVTCWCGLRQTAAEEAAVAAAAAAASLGKVLADVERARVRHAAAVAASATSAAVAQLSREYPRRCTRAAAVAAAAVPAAVVVEWRGRVRTSAAASALAAALAAASSAHVAAAAARENERRKLAVAMAVSAGAAAAAAAARERRRATRAAVPAAAAAAAAAAWTEQRALAARSAAGQSACAAGLAAAAVAAVVLSAELEARAATLAAEARVAAAASALAVAAATRALVDELIRDAAVAGAVAAAVTAAAEERTAAAAHGTAAAALAVAAITATPLALSQPGSSYEADIDPHSGSSTASGTPPAHRTARTVAAAFAVVAGAVAVRAARWRRAGQVDAGGRHVLVKGVGKYDWEQHSEPELSSFWPTHRKVPETLITDIHVPEAESGMDSIVPRLSEEGLSVAPVHVGGGTSPPAPFVELRFRFPVDSRRAEAVWDDETRRLRVWAPVRLPGHGTARPLRTDGEAVVSATAAAAVAAAATAARLDRQRSRGKVECGGRHVVVTGTGRYTGPGPARKKAPASLSAEIHLPEVQRSMDECSINVAPEGLSICAADDSKGEKPFVELRFTFTIDPATATAKFTAATKMLKFEAQVRLSEEER